ncbi:MAG: class I SAM-dependent methyltransferase [Bryobacteraceae bacterium]
MVLGFIFLLMLQTEHGGHHPPRDAEAYAKILEDPERDRWQKPLVVIEALRLRPNEIVADIGAGSGYFTRRIAIHVSKVFAVDLDAKLLAKTKDSSPANVETVLAKPDDPKLPPESVDTIFFCDVLHHIENRAAYYKKLNAALKPGGRIVIVDFHKRELPVGPKPPMKLEPEQVKAEFEHAGFRLKSEHRGLLEYQYFLEFER